MVINFEISLKTIKNIAIIVIVLIIGWNFYNISFSNSNPELKKAIKQLDSLKLEIKKDRKNYRIKLDSFEFFKQQSTKRIDSFIKVQKYHNWKFNNAIKSRDKNKQEYENNKDNITRSSNAISKSIRTNITE